MNKSHDDEQQPVREASFVLLRGKFMFAGLIGLLIAFSVWCVVLLWRSHELRRDLDQHLGWIEDLRRLRGDLDRPRAGPGPGDPSRTGGPQAYPDLSADAAGALERRAAPELQVAVQSLRGALDRLHAGLDSGTSADDAVWEAAAAARSAVDTLEGQVQNQVSLLHARLGGHWNQLYALIVASLLLAGSNLALLHLAHRRRLRLEQAHTEALRQATQDPLTRVWNREAILRLLRRELTRAARLETPLGVILADVDEFQQINVLLGQDQGDFILEQLAERLAKFVRPYDTMGRFGGDAFLVVLPVCDEIATGNVADRLREAVNERDMEHALGRIRVTVSLASATVHSGEGADADLLMHRLQECITGLQAQGPGRLAKL